MKRKTDQINVRVTSSERANLEAVAERSHMTVSRVTRALIQLPVTTVPENGGLKTVVVLDSESVPRIAREMRRWGYHYNQACHALNSLAYYMVRGKVDYGDCVERLEVIEEKVADMNRGVDRLRGDFSKIADCYYAVV
ncbi:hypothetical protein [Cryptobacterium curtum]|uniref:hypothetical protein n=1 Tax=Cryptobacterium curtum TaxID=84163 RepID=UPI00248F07BE|nr:hypothetical protein [Cryptobacterium curtum]